MQTELHIINTIWDTVRAGLKNQDDPINERLMRAYLASHRGRILNEHYVNARQLPDEVFQNFGAVGPNQGDVTFSLTRNQWIATSAIPTVIRFKENFGFMAEKEHYIVSFLNSEEFRNNKYDRYGKFHPSIQYIGREMILYTGIQQTGNPLGDLPSVLNNAVAAIATEALGNKITIKMRGVLVNPDDDALYDFNTSAYPFPNELLDKLINSVTARDFNVFLRTKSDEVGDGRDNPGQYQNGKELD